MSNGQAFAPGQPASYRIPDRPKDWFSYVIQFTAVAEGDRDSQNIQIDASSDFFLTALTYFATINASTAVIDVSTTVVPVATLLITDNGSNRQLSNAPVPLFLLAGDGNHPHRLIHPRLFRANSSVAFTLNSLDTAQNLTYDNIWINLEGFKIYL